MPATRMVITIAQEEGSGGCRIAGELAQNLNLIYLDNARIELAVQELGIDLEDSAFFEEVLANVDEICRYITASQLVSQGLACGMPHREWAGMPHDFGPPYGKAIPEGELARLNYHRLVEEIIKKVAADGYAVFRDCGASFVLKDWEGVVNVFIHAPHKFRVNHLIQHHLLDRAAACEQVDSCDSEQAGYVREFYGPDWTNPDLYHLVINTALVAPSAATAAITRFARELNPRPVVPETVVAPEYYDTCIPMDYIDRLTSEEAALYVEAAVVTFAKQEASLPGD